MATRPFFYKVTNRIRISVRPQYMADQSQPFLRRYIFAYFVRIENVGKQVVQLISRRWHIHDSIGEEYEVSGEGVIGEQPVLGPGDTHEYQSFCILKSPSGFMEGSYHFIAQGAPSFDAAIPRFLLEADEARRTP